MMKSNRRNIPSLFIGAVAIANCVTADVISNFDFSGPPWTNAKEASFAVFAANAVSVDDDLNSLTSFLSNNAGSGELYNGGGYASFYIRDADLTIDPAIFSTSATPGVGMNVANADFTEATNYIGFSVKSLAGFETTFQSLQFFSSSFLGGDSYDIELRAVVAGGGEVTLGSYQRTMPALDNSPVEAGTIDFEDFTSNGVVEFRLYIYNIGQDNGGFRIDDLILNGVTSAGGSVSPPSESVVLIDHTFDGASNDIGSDFQQVANGLGIGGSSNTTSGLITTGDRSDSAYGLNNVTSVDVATADPSAIGFRATFEVKESTAGVSALSANGMFFGIVSGVGATGTDGPSLWNNSPNALGYVAGSSNYGNNIVRQDGNTNYALSGEEPTNESFQSGFTVSVSVFKDNTWSVSSVGLSDDVDQCGFLNTADFSYADIVSDIGLFTSLQGQVGASLEISRMTLSTLVSNQNKLELTSIVKLGNIAAVQFTGSEGVEYILNKSTTLDFSVRNEIGSLTLDDSGVGEIQDANATEAKAFYRIEVR